MTAAPVKSLPEVAQDLIDLAARIGNAGVLEEIANGAHAALEQLEAMPDEALRARALIAARWLINFATGGDDVGAIEHAARTLVAEVPRLRIALDAEKNCGGRRAA